MYFILILVVVILVIIRCPVVGCVVFLFFFSFSQLFHVLIKCVMVVVINVCVVLKFFLFHM